MGSIDRVKSYAAGKGSNGTSSKESLVYWASCAEKNSQMAPRARGGEMCLPNTGKRMALRNTSMRQYEHRKVNRKMAGKDD